MGTTNSGPASEYAGTGNDSEELGSGATVGKSEPIDPRSLDGSGDRNGGGNSGGGSGEFDPAIHVGRDKRNQDGGYTRKRGRKSGSKSYREKASASDLKTSIDALTKSLVVVHTGIAAITSTPEIAIDGNEAKMLAEASANVLEQFDLSPDPKTQAIIGLLMACGAVYGPRIIAIRMSRAQAKKEQSPGTAGVYSADGHAQGTTQYKENTAPPSGETSFVELGDT